MTTLISWVGVDSRGASSIYIASDSRISWSQYQRWDTGRKLFASKTMPEIFGYSGDVTFPVQILGQIIEQVDSGLLFDKKEAFQSKLEKVFNFVKSSFCKYPKEHQRTFEILYLSRTYSGMDACFHASKISWNTCSKWKCINLTIPVKSGLIDGTGSGAGTLKDWYIKWQSGDSKRTSRSVFCAFCDSLKFGDDPLSGGAPQLIGIYRNDSARSFGIIYDEQRYLHGQEVISTTSLDGIEWRNRLFERCSGESMTLLDGAQPQPKPKGM